MSSGMVARATIKHSLLWCLLTICLPRTPIRTRLRSIEELVRVSLWGITCNLGGGSLATTTVLISKPFGRIRWRGLRM